MSRCKVKCNQLKITWNRVSLLIILFSVPFPQLHQNDLTLSDTASYSDGFLIIVVSKTTSAGFEF